MSDQPDHEHQLNHPETVKGPDGTRWDGRPTNQGDVTEAHVPPGGAPTEAPEDRGQQPDTEHAPGGDL